MTAIQITGALTMLSTNGDGAQLLTEAAEFLNALAQMGVQVAVKNQPAARECYCCVACTDANHYAPRRHSPAASRGTDHWKHAPRKPYSGGPYPSGPGPAGRTAPKGKPDAVERPRPRRARRPAQYGGAQAGKGTRPRAENDRMGRKPAQRVPVSQRRVEVSQHRLDVSGSELEPAADHMSHTWRRVRIRVAPNEMTCCRCGETFTEGDRCAVCCTDEQGKLRKVQPPSVPTISYLNEGEWETQ